MEASQPLVPVERLETVILLVRGHKAILDADLATLYGVETRELVRAVKRNLDRFPRDFMFRLSKDEFENLRSHFGTSSSWGGRRYLPYAFTELGVAMLSSVLRSARAISVNIEIMRAFVRLRRMLASHEELARRLAALEQRYDAQFRVVFDAIRELMEPVADPPRERIGFHSGPPHPAPPSAQQAARRARNRGVGGARSAARRRSGRGAGKAATVRHGRA